MKDRRTTSSLGVYMGKNKRKSTILDVASRAEVAISTVSHVINGTATITDETRQRVLDAIADLNYKPNALARSLRKNQTKLIGLVVPDITIEFYADFAKGVMESLYTEGYTVVLCGTQYDIKREIMEVDALVERRADGLIFVGGSSDEDYIMKLKDFNMPIVLADRNITNSAISSIEFDNVMALKSLISHVCLGGHKKIGYISEPVHWTNLQDRLLGFKFALMENNIEYDDDNIYIDERLKLDKIENSYSMMKDILKSKDLGSLPSVFVTTSDLIAIGIINALNEKGIRVPDDIAITGFDDVLMATYISPPLTTIRQDKVSMGRMSAELLLKVINQNEIAPQRILLEPQLVVRKSC